MATRRQVEQEEPEALVATGLDLEPEQEVPEGEPPGYHKYGTGYLKRNGLPYCSKCGSQFMSAPDGSPVCAEAKADCPRLV